MTEIIAYIDGATRGNQFEKNLGAWAVVLAYGNKQKEFGDIILDTTNNICEITSAIQALSAIKNKKIKTKIISDSQYVVAGVNEWSKNWIVNGWKNAKNKPIENQGLWRWLLDLIALFDDIEFVKCSGHSDNVGNNEVDAYCNKLMDEYKEKK
jgi:ribonuclease HI